MGTYIASTALQLPIAVELLGVIAATLGGALTACELKLDLVGAAGLGLLSGLGGGLVRDMIMQCGSVYILEAYYAIPTSVVVALIAFFFRGMFKKLDSLIEWADIISVGLFAATGTDKAILYGVFPIAAIFMGLLTANGGGMLRDVFLGDIPTIFQRGNYYALCGLTGSVVYWVAVVPLGLSKTIAAILCVVATVVLRRLSLHFNLMTSNEIDLTEKISMPIHHTTEDKKSQSNKNK